MNDLTVSVVVVSRGRPGALKRCLTGISQLQRVRFEVVVVADPGGIEAAQALPFAQALKLVPFDEPNISAARNLGLSHAAGEVVAFIDDDAVPEPLWLFHLTGPAVRPEVAAMGGYVIGRNGISFQWTAQSVDTGGQSRPLDIDLVQPTLLAPPQGRGIKTEGTNMAFRRTALVALGGFDPAFHYYLDETDLNLRLAREGHLTALVPLAQVHHGFAANGVRSAARVPTDLFEIGASWGVFQRKHVEKNARKEHWRMQRDAQRRRLLSHMVRGTLEPFDVRRLLQGLELGYAEGMTRRIDRETSATHPQAPFQPFPARLRPVVLLTSRLTNAARMRAEAARRVSDGEIVTLLVLSPTSLYHRVEFTQDGFWEQRGGVFGRSDRGQRMIQVSTLGRRAREETQRVASVRGFSPKSGTKNATKA